jgi:hypothetical protein
LLFPGREVAAGYCLRNKPDGKGWRYVVRTRPTICNRLKRLLGLIALKYPLDMEVVIQDGGDEISDS